MEMISIIIPMYNEEEAIGDDLDTIIQTMSRSDIPWEIIVVDDGSTDGSAEIVRQREGVRLIQHPYNRGTGAARTTGLQQECHLLGFIPDEDKRDLLDAGDVFVMPSRTDSFGIVYLESWLYKKPVIGALAGGVPEVISHGEDGYLVPFGDVTRLADCIATLLTDKDLARRFGEAGCRKVLTEHTWDKKYDMISQVYRQLGAVFGRPDGP